MRIKTTILAFLAKAMKGNADQEPGDSNVLVPNLFQNVLEIPHQFFFFDTVPVVDTIRSSRILNDSRLFATVNINVVLLVVGSGLWEIEYHHWLNPEGATSDVTSSVRLTCILNEGVSPLVELSRLTNTGTIPQLVIQGRFKVMIPAEQTLQFNVAGTSGAGTGTQRSNIVLKAIRYL